MKTETAYCVECERTGQHTAGPVYNVDGQQLCAQHRTAGGLGGVPPLKPEGQAKVTKAQDEKMPTADPGKRLRPELPPLIPRIAALPVDDRGYPVPFFVAYVDGKPDFRISDAAKWVRCVKEKLCWVCGQPMGIHQAFVIGPMCAITRTTAEPPSHLDCAMWSLRGCPFMMRPKMVRREGGLDGLDVTPPPGIMIDRNPGVMCLWITRQYALFRDQKGDPLIHVGDPHTVSWWSQGRTATRAEILASIESGLPRLKELCANGDELSSLRKQQLAVEDWLPDE